MSLTRAEVATGKEQFEVLQFNGVEARNCPIVGARYADGYRGSERVQFGLVIMCAKNKNLTKRESIILCLLA